MDIDTPVETAPPRVLSDDAKRLLLWARTLVLKTEEQYESHYRSSLSTTAKKQIGLIPSIRYQRPADCVFPWDILVNQRQVPTQQPTPTLNPVIPDIPIMVDYNQQTEEPAIITPAVVEEQIVHVL